MLEYGIPVTFTVLAWWFLTGAILWLDRLPTRTFRYSMLGATVVLGAALYALIDTRARTTPMGSYVAFTAALLIWGWIETSFLLGYVTGPRTHGCPASCRGWRHFVHAIEAILYHEIAIMVAAGAIALLTFGAPNRFALWTFLSLWLLRESAKLNLFLGVPNVGDRLLPDHLAYLGSFFRRRSMNALLPFSLTGATLLTVLAAGRAVDDAATAGASLGWTLLATLLGLATLEHWFMVVPLPSEALWRLSMRTPPSKPSLPPERVPCPPL